jgi:hypothetical protein
MKLMSRGFVIYNKKEGSLSGRSFVFRWPEKARRFPFLGFTLSLARFVVYITIRFFSARWEELPWGCLAFAI